MPRAPSCFARLPGNARTTGIALSPLAGIAFSGSAGASALMLADPSRHIAGMRQPEFATEPGIARHDTARGSKR
jgi:hypothetical protein